MMKELAKTTIFENIFKLFPKKPPLGGRPNTKPGDDGTLNAHNH
jgi:hypothetical protein